MLLTVGVIFTVLMIIAVVIHSSNNNARDEEKSEQEGYLQNEGITISNEYRFKNVMNDINIRFVIDGDAKKILVSQTSATFDTIPYSEVIGCAVLIDSQITGGIGRAVVGGVVAGDVGALVGAVTAKPHIMSYKIVIYRNSVSTPVYEIPLIKSKVSEKDIDYKNAVEFANNVNSIIKVVLWFNQQ